MLPRKDWRPENIVRVMTVVTMSWFGAMALAMMFVATRNQQGVELSPLVTLAVVGLAFHGVGLIAVARLVQSEHRTWAEAFGLTRTPLRAVGVAAGATVIVAPLVYLLHFASSIVLRRLGLDPEPQEAVELLMKSGWAVRAAMAGFAVVLAPIVEELLFRGLLFPLFRDLGWSRVAWWGTALAFGFIHLNAAAFVPLSAFGLFLAWLYARTGNLLAPITAHLLFNLIPFVTIALGINWEP
ncbi:MAG TPA: CPBP family intramembrane metalloprotease [Verrucomicrobiota bacterium]|nr:CPBP family intramembrane metalloprotease [Verrucomicrobiota bacterium]